MRSRRSALAAVTAALVLGTIAVPAVGQDAPPPAPDACPDGAPSAGFEDVASTNVHAAAIDCAADRGVIRGTSTTPKLFSPSTNLTRAQAASLIARSLDDAGISLPTAADQPFEDVEGNVHADNIAALAALGVVQGRADGSFVPGQLVQRDQLASMVTRAYAQVTTKAVTPTGGPYFTDVTGGVHRANVDAAYELGILQGRNDGSFDPARATRRDQAASVITRFIGVVSVLDADATTVTLLYDTHFHGKYSQGDVGIANYFALVQERKDRVGDNSLFLANGDDPAPSVFSGLFEPRGIHMIDALNESPIDVNTLGNHEFDYGPDNLRELIAAADYPYVTANVRDIGSGDVFGADLGVEEYEIFELDGVTVGVTGLAPEGMDTITTLGDETEQVQAAAALDIVVPKMRDDGAEIIVVSSHLCGTDAIALADAYEGVDVFAGDHCAQVLEEPYVSDNGTIVSLVGDEYALMGELKLIVEDGEVADFRFTLHEVDGFVDRTPIAGIQSVVDSYTAQLDEALNVTIGERTVDWNTVTTVVRTRENALGNYFTDEMRTAFGGSDIAVTNSGGLRGNQVYETGEITRRDIAEILPFGNRLVQAEISGAAILEALERSVRSVPDPDGGFLQVSGIEFEFDSSLAAGSRVDASSVLIGGEALVTTETYTMATNDFTLAGGDAYSMFVGLNVLIDGNAGPVLDSFLIERIEARDGAPIDTPIEGRIVDTNS
jgi:2',3'-cyclic-nucleotide 2'-phosphodiesterase (5'-nucleotidase family)